MPLYEYLCSLCHRPFTVLVGVTAASDNSTCPNCGSMHATRRVTRFARLHSNDEIIDRFTSSQSDTASPKEWAGQLEEAAGMGLGEDFEEYLDEPEDAGDQ